MITQEDLVNGYAVNVRLIRMQTEGVSHEESLLTTPYRINTLNWVVGHIATGRDRVLELVGELPVFSQEARARYTTGSDPALTGDPTVIRLEKLLEQLDTGQERIQRGILRLTPDDLKKQIQVGEHTLTIGKRLYGLYFHDTYHTGQTDLLRQVAGKNDSII